MTDFSYLEPFPLEIRKLLIQIKEVASVCDDPRYRTALIHQRQKLINRLNEFVEADKREAEAAATALEDALITITTTETINDTPTHPTESDPCRIPA